MKFIMGEIKNISGSLIWLFDNDINGFKRKYIDGLDDFEPNEHMQFGIDYENLVSMKNYTMYNKQTMILKDFYGYSIIGFIDFSGFGEWVECKTKSGRWSENMIRKNRQFRIYNHYRGKNRFLLHQYNKLRREIKIQDIGREDKSFESELLEKIKEIENYISQYGFKFINNKNV